MFFTDETDDQYLAELRTALEVTNVQRHGLCWQRSVPPQQLCITLPRHVPRRAHRTQATPIFLQASESVLHGDAVLRARAGSFHLHPAPVVTHQAYDLTLCPGRIAAWRQLPDLCCESRHPRKVGVGVAMGPAGLLRLAFGREDEHDPESTQSPET